MNMNMNKDSSPVKAALEMVKDSISKNWYVCRATSEEAATNPHRSAVTVLRLTLFKVRSYLRL